MNSFLNCGIGSNDVEQYHKELRKLIITKEVPINTTVALANGDEGIFSTIFIPLSETNDEEADEKETDDEEEEADSDEDVSEEEEEEEEIIDYDTDEDIESDINDDCDVGYNKENTSNTTTPSSTPARSTKTTPQVVETPNLVKYQLNEQTSHTSLTPGINSVNLEAQNESNSNSRVVVSCMRGTPLGKNLVPVLNLRHFQRVSKVSKKLNYK